MSIAAALNAIPAIPPEAISGVVVVLAVIEVVRLIRAAKQIWSWVCGVRTRIVRKVRRYGKRKLLELLQDTDFEEVEKAKRTDQDFVGIKQDGGETGDNEPSEIETSVP